MIVNNANLVSALGGTLSLDNGGSGSATFFANANCFLNFGGGTQTLLGGANFAGAGSIRVNGGVLSFAAPILINQNFELANGGSIDGTNVATFGGFFAWTGGTMDSAVGPGGRTVFTNGVAVAINSGGTKALYRRTLDNYTTVNWSGGIINQGGGGIWNNFSGSTFDVEGDLTMSNALANPLTFNNFGTLKKTSGGATASLNIAVNNPGLVNCLSGTFSLDNGGTSTGTFNANSACILNFGGGMQTFLGGANFTGSGLFRVNGGTLNFAAATVMNRAFELAANGTIDGTNLTIFSGPFTWSGGTMDSSLGPGGRTVFTNTASVSINTSAAKSLFRRIVDNYTVVNWTGGVVNEGGSGTWNNFAGATFDIQGDLTMTNTVADPITFNNFGTLRKTAGTDGALFSCNITNAGTVRSQSGVLAFPQIYVQTSGLTELAGGNFSGVLLDIRAGLLTGSGNIAANVSNGGEVAPGSGVGLLSISNASPQTYSGTAAGQITFQIGGLTPITGHDQLRVNSSAALAGVIHCGLANGYVPAPGNSYTVMTFTARSGLFTNFVFPDYAFRVVQTETNIILLASNAFPQLTFGAPTQQLVCAAYRLTAQTADIDGTVTNLLLLLNTNLIASIPNPSASPYQFDLSYDFPGPVTFTARASDDQGAVNETNINTLFYTMPLNVLSLGGFVTNAGFKFCMAGETGKTYETLVNDDLSTTNWFFVGLMEYTNGIWRFTDTGTTDYVHRYYRVHQLP